MSTIITNRYKKVTLSRNFKLNTIIKSRIRTNATALRTGFETPNRYTAPHQLALVTRNKGQSANPSRNSTIAKPETSSLVYIGATRQRVYEVDLSIKRNPNLLLLRKPIQYVCEKFAADSSNKLFCEQLPQMLEKRFDELVKFGKSENKLIILNSSIVEMMKYEGFGDMLTEKVANLIQYKYKALSQRKFALLLLKILTATTERKLKFCFELFDFSRNNFLDCATLCAWYQSDAEPLIRNDLLSICKLLKTCNFNNKKQNESNNHQDKKVLKQCSNWNLGLWGHVCKKLSKSFRDHLQASFRTIIADKIIKVDGNTRDSVCKIRGEGDGEKERIKSEEFKEVVFVNGEVPDVLFLVIQMIYGVEVCDAYCNYLGIKLFRPYNKDNRLILNKIHPLPLNVLQKFK